jgi:hypothetical protein
VESGNHAYCFTAITTPFLFGERKPLVTPRSYIDRCT